MPHPIVHEELLLLLRSDTSSAARQALDTRIGDAAARTARTTRP